MTKQIEIRNVTIQMVVDYDRREPKLLSWAAYTQDNSFLWIGVVDSISDKSSSSLRIDRTKAT